MDDDVKNLFQKFGQSTEAYREINRDADSEQARQRWPLLRDVHLHAAAPAVAPVRVRHREEEVAPPTAQAPLPSNDSPFRPAAAKPAAARSVAVKARPAQAVPEVHASIKHNSQLPLKQMLMQKAAVEEREPEPAAAAEVPRFLSKILPAAPKPGASPSREAAATGLFSSRAQVPSPETQAAVSGAVPGIAAFASARKSASATPTATVIHSLPAAHAIPVTPARQAPEPAVEARDSGVKTRPASKEQAVSAVFGRLAGKQEEARPADPGTNSFFKKIFKP